MVDWDQQGRTAAGSIPGWIIVVAALASLALLAGNSPADTGRQALAKQCSERGLEFSYTDGSATYGNKVTDLRAKGVSCLTARDIARKVAKDLLYDRPVPDRIHGLRITVDEPCTGCSPNTDVTAADRDRKVTFVVKGGA